MRMGVARGLFSNESGMGSAPIVAAASKTPNAVKQSLLCFIAVGTPQGEDGSADLQYVLQVAESIGKATNGYKVIVDKSTVPVGTAEKVRKIIAQHTTYDFDTAQISSALR